jgi:predicted nucleic acid-binding protein
MTLVLDASALAEFLVSRDAGERVASRLRDDDDLHVPHLVTVEVASVMRRWARLGVIDPDRGAAALADLAAFPAERWPADPHLGRIWELRGNLSAYDATYVALAEALDASLLTGDARLARAAADAGARCRVVAV